MKVVSGNTGSSIQLLNGVLNELLDVACLPVTLELNSQDEILAQIANANGCHVVDILTLENLSQQSLPELWFSWPSDRVHGTASIETEVDNTDQPQLFFFPFGRPTGNPTSVVSSRIGRRLHEQSAWFQAFRTMATRMDESEYFVTCPGTVTDRFIERIGFWYNRRWIRVNQVTSAKIKTVFRDLRKLRGMVASVAYRVVSEHSAITQHDQLQIQIANKVHVLQLREGGNIHTAISKECVESGHLDGPNKFYLMLAKTNPSNPYIQRLLEQGAIGWYLYDDNEILQSMEGDLRVMRSHFVSLDDLSPENYFAHFTRRQDGPWVDECEQQYVDALLLGLDNSNRDTLTTLFRIVCQNRLLATNRMTRDSTPVVSFTEVPITEFAKKRKFQSHLGRWDFEPYGIAICKKWLRQQGARTVIYGDDETWNNLNKAEQPYFQNSGNASKWTHEREIRVIGHVDLKSLPQDKAFLFVPNVDDASRLAPLSRWPVAIV